LVGFMMQFCCIVALLIIVSIVIRLSKKIG
jgi:hypothetical protein